MSDRSILVRYRADISDLQAKSRSGAQAVKGVADAADAASKKSTGLSGIGVSLGKGLDKVQTNSKDINTLGNGFLTLGVAAAAGVAVATKSFADFDSAMSSVKATGADARENFDALRQAAVDAGAATSFSATEAAAGIENLLKAGVSAKDVLGGGLQGALDLAAAGGTDVAFAAEAAATAMSQFGLKGQDVTHIADLMAQAAGTAQGEVTDMAMALKQSGSVASQFGLSIDETAQALAVFAKEGGIGSDAGTSFKTMLMSLYAPTGSAAKTLEKLGVSAYDATGALKPIGSVLDELRGRLDTLSEGDRNKDLVTLFGTDGIRAANALLKDGSAGLQQMGSEFKNFGSAADVASTKLDNLKGDFEGFTGALDTTLIQTGSGANDALRSLTKDATEAVKWFGQLPAPLLEGGIRMAALGAGGLLAAGGVAKLATTAADAYSSFQSLAESSPRAAGALGKVGKAAGLAAGGVVLFTAAAQVGNALIDGAYVDGLEDTTTALLKLAATSDQTTLDGLFQSAPTIFKRSDDLVYGVNNVDSALDRMFNKSWGERFNDFGSSLFAWTGATSEMDQLSASFGNLDQSLTSLVSSGRTEEAASGFEQIAASAHNQGIAYDQLLTLFPKYGDALRKQANDLGVTNLTAADYVSWMGGKVPAAITAAAAANPKLGAAIGDVNQKVEEQVLTVDEAIAKLFEYSNTLLSMSGGQIGMEAAIDAATASLKENGATLDLNTAKGRNNQQALDQLAAATQTNVTEMTKAGASQEAINAANDRGRSKWIKLADAMGLSKPAAKALAAELFKIPDQKEVKFATPGAELSANQAAQVNKALKDIPEEKRAEIITIAETKGAKAAYMAMARVIDKEVTAKTKGDPAGARKVKSEMDKLRDRLVKALARGDERGATKVINEMKKLRDKTVKAKADAQGEGEVRKLVGAVGALHDKTITIHTKYKTTGSSKQAHNDGAGGGSPKGATGGLFTGAGFIRRSEGGPVWGAGTATSDSIPALLSNGEFVIRAAAVKAFGVDNLFGINRMGFAAGGEVTAPATKGVDFTAIWAMVTALTRPLASIIANEAARAKAAAVLARENREIAAARRAVKSGGATKAEKANLTKQTEQQKAAQEKLTETTNNLRSAQQQLADSARSQSEELAAPYRSKSTDIDDWLESMRTGAVDLKAFQGQIASLRKLGVAETVVQQIADQGAVVGSELAQQILQGGKALANSLNLANGNLQKAADGLGYDVVQATGRYATGGPVYGPGTATSDSVLARLSAGEWVVPAKAVPGNLGLLQAMTYGTGGGDIPQYASGGMVRTEVTKTFHHHHNQYVTVTSPDPDTIIRKMNNSARNALTMANHGVAL